MGLTQGVRPVVCLGIAVLLPASQAQTAELADRALAERQLVQWADSERGRGITLEYRQKYVSESRSVHLQGTVYAVLSSLEAKNCRLQMQVSVTDQYSGALGKTPIPLTQAIDRSSAEFALDEETLASVRVVEGRPLRLAANTHPMCEEHAACAIPWVEIRTQRPALNVVNTTNDLAGYDGFVTRPTVQVDRFAVPLSSIEAAKVLAEELKTLSDLCRR